jgi:predicted RNase H-like HicB family nuclease
MTRIRFVHWKEEDFHLGHFEDYPDYLTQGESYEELVENLKDLYKDLASGAIPFLKKVDELVVVE